MIFTVPDTDTRFARRHTREPLNAAGGRASALFPPAAGRVKIGFAGLSGGAGATTLSFAAAEYLAAISKKPGREAGAFARQAGRSITFLELDMRPDAPAGRPYDKVGIDRRFAGREFTPLYRLAAEGKPLRGVSNLDGGVGWALRVPGESGPLPAPITLHRLLNNVSGDIIICDIPALGILNSAKTGTNDAAWPPAAAAGGLTADAAGRAALLALLVDLDRIVCVFDPLPSSLLAAVPAAEICRAAAAEGVPTTWVFNKLNAGVNLREATRFTGIRDYLSFPAVPAEAVYGAEYACRSLASDPGIKAALTTLFEIQ